MKKTIIIIIFILLFFGLMIIGGFKKQEKSMSDRCCGIFVYQGEGGGIRFDPGEGRSIKECLFWIDVEMRNL